MLTVSSSAKLFSTAAYERQTSFINKAEGKGLVYHKGEMKAETRRMGITVLKMPKGGEGDDTGILEEELFGPILPVVPVKVRQCLMHITPCRAERADCRRSGSVHQCSTTPPGAISMLQVEQDPEIRSVCTSVRLSRNHADCSQLRTTPSLAQ
jgi:hypothetical protein